MADESIAAMCLPVTLAELRAGDLKRCFKCEMVKPLAAFSKDKTRGDGLQPKCKACHAIYKAKNAKRIAAKNAGMAPTVMDLYPSGTIVCDVCLDKKPLSEFKQYAIPHNTFRPSCNQCHFLRMEKHLASESARKLQWRVNNPDWCRNYDKQWVANNPDKVRAKARKCYHMHRAKRAAWSAAKRLANIESIREHERKCYALNAETIRARKRLSSALRRKIDPEPERAKGHRRRARAKGAPGTFTANDIRFLIETQRNRCALPWCRKSLRSGRHIDHIMPLMLGGSNNRCNLQLLCPGCNIQKSAKHPVDFARQNGMLV